jgi:hypothetical protein
MTDASIRMGSSTRGIQNTTRKGLDRLFTVRKNTQRSTLIANGSVRSSFSVYCTSGFAYTIAQQPFCAKRRHIQTHTGST